MLVFEYVEDHLLFWLQKELSLEQIKQALKWTLEGISQLHALGIAHNGIPFLPLYAFISKHQLIQRRYQTQQHSRANRTIPRRHRN